ncbi:hypothetical protein FIE12Z_8576 [Fusarium flagelliforme]|uniref:Uncharacterized protein n=1 Tax=Fusarium flagelliforme TaxID=2675880 RepID=A0A395MIR1_9HYPO|nr:hypothetical protein FIE12Z_8576 [Fusarium flagelliforme]
MDTVKALIKPIGSLKPLSTFHELDAASRDNMSAQSQVARFFRFQRLQCRAAVRLLRRLQQLFPDINFGWVHEARLEEINTGANSLDDNTTLTTHGFSPSVLGDGRQ